MNSLPANQRGAGGGMAATFMNSAMVLSIGIFFSLMIVGLSGGLHQSLYNGLTAHGVSAGRGARRPPTCRRWPPCSRRSWATTRSRRCSAPTSTPCRPHQQHILLGHTFFPSVISGPFSSALTSAFTFGLVACLIAALASLVPAKGQPWFGRGRPRRRR